MSYYINRPGIDKAEIVQDGRLYPVVMSIPLGSAGSPDSTGGSVPGFNIPPYDSVSIVEDSQDYTISVEYLMGGVQVAMLNFTYSDHAAVGPNKTTTILRS